MKHQGYEIQGWDGSLTGCALGNCGSASFGMIACWYNKANMNQASQTAKFYTKWSEH